ncbi:MAG: phosphotransferase [Pirellulaceae bacterium]
MIPDQVKSFLEQCGLDMRSTKITPWDKDGFSISTIYQISDSNRGSLFCLRNWGDNAIAATRLNWIHERLKDLEQFSFIPNVQKTSHGESYVQKNEQLWELTTWVPGTASFNLAPNSFRLKNIIEAINALHETWAKVESDHGRSPAIAERVEILEQLQPRLKAAIPSTETLQRVFRNIDFGVTQHLASKLSFQLLAESQTLHWNDMSRRLQPVVKDLRHEHILFTGDYVTGIVDFGAMAIDCVECDWARLLGSLRFGNISVWQLARELIQKNSLPIPIDWNLVKWLHRSSTLIAWTNWLEWMSDSSSGYAQLPHAWERFSWTTAQLLGCENGDDNSEPGQIILP